MERELTIHYQNNYFGSITMYYDKYYQGNMWAQRREFKQTNIDNQMIIDVTDHYSKLDSFYHSKIESSDLFAHDRANFYSSFGKEIEEKKLDRNAFDLHYSNNLSFSRLLFNKNQELLGNATININSVEQTKVFSFEPFHPTLDHLRLRTQEPFSKINKHILFEYCNTKISILFPDSYFR